MDRPELTAAEWKAAHLKLLTAFRELWWAARPVLDFSETIDIQVDRLRKLKDVLDETIEFTA